MEGACGPLQHRRNQMPNEKSITASKGPSTDKVVAMPSTSAQSITDVETKVVAPRVDPDSPGPTNEQDSMSAFIDSSDEGPSGNLASDDSEDDSESSVEDDNDTVENDDEVLEPDLSMFEDSSEAAQEEEEEEEESFLEIYHDNCLKCKSLIPFMKQSFKSCHYDAGNKACPAQTVKIIYQIPLGTIVPKFMQAEAEADFDRIAKLSRVLASKPDWYQQRVGEALKEKRLERAG